MSLDEQDFEPTATAQRERQNAPTRASDGEARETRAALEQIAREESWLAPTPAIARVRLRPWTRAALWALRVYIALMLLAMAWAFMHGVGR